MTLGTVERQEARSTNDFRFSENTERECPEPTEGTRGQSVHIKYRDIHYGFRVAIPQILFPVTRIDGGPLLPLNPGCSCNGERVKADVVLGLFCRLYCSSNSLGRYYQGFRETLRPRFSMAGASLEVSLEVITPRPSTKRGV